MLTLPSTYTSPTPGTTRWPHTAPPASSCGGSSCEVPSSCRFNNPRDVAYLNGKLYVDDTGWNRVQVLNASNGAAISQWPVRFGSTL